MSYTLILWTVVAAGHNIYSDWRPVADFYQLSTCEEAAKQLNVAGRYRCLKK